MPKFKIALLPVLLFWIAAVNAAAGETFLSLFTDLKGTFNDNIHLTDEDRKSDFTTGLTENIRFGHRSERGMLNLNGMLKGVFYANETQYNKTFYRLGADVSRSLTERLYWTASVVSLSEYAQDRIIETGVLVTDIAEHKKGISKTALSWSGTERLTFSASYDYIRDDYESVQLIDQKEQHFRLDTLYKLTELKTIMLGLLCQDYEYPEANVRLYGTVLTFSDMISERWNYRLYAGAKLLKSKYRQWYTDFIPSPPFYTRRSEEVEKESWNYTWQADFKYDHGGWDLKMNGFHDIQSAAGTGQASKRTGAGIFFYNGLAENMDCYISAQYYLNEYLLADLELETEKAETWVITSKIAYEPMESMTIELQHQFTALTDAGRDSDITKNMIYLGLSYFWNN